MKGKLRQITPLQAPFISVKTQITMPGKTNGMPNIKYENRYVIAPSAKKIGTYIVNQIFGSDLVTQTEGLNIGWLMPTLKESLEECIYDKESFIYINKYDNKVYLEVIKKCNIANLEQVYDKIKSCDIIQDFDEFEDDYMLKRHIEIKDGTSTIEFSAYQKDKKETSWIKINLDKLNNLIGTDYKRKYVLPYEVIINLDIGEEFFKDSTKLLNEEMNIINTIAEEIEKTKTRIVTTQHYQTSDITNSWRPGGTTYNVETMSVGKLNDFFTLMPGDKEHQVFEFLQGDIRIEQYQNAFKFYDYQIIQMAGLSPSSFGYEKDAYMNKTNVELSANASEMTIEAIKTQLESQINHLIENIIKLQQLLDTTENTLPVDLSWDYGSNERFDDEAKLERLKQIQQVMLIPYKTKARIVEPMLKQIMDSKVDEDNLERLLQDYKDENIEINYGEL
jgi:hypothetical protein